MEVEKTLSTIFLRHLARELDSELSGGFFDKAQQIGPAEFKLSFRTKAGKKDVIVRLPGLVNITSYKIPAPRKPSNFAMKLRKEISGKKVLAVKQHDFDRVIVLDFGEKKLVIELFSKGNLVLTKDGRILAVFRSEEWRDRKLRFGEEYVFPKKKADPESEDFREMLCREGERALALAVGKENARLLLKSLGIPQGQKEYSEEQAGRILSRLEEILNSDTKPVVQEGILLPVPILSSEPEKEYRTASQAVDEEHPPELRREEGKESKLQRMLEMQKKTLQEYQKKAEEEKQIGDLIMQNAHVIAEAIRLFKEKDVKGLERLGARITKDGKIEIDL